MNPKLKALIKALNDVKDDIDFGKQEDGISYFEKGEDGEVTKRYFVKLRFVNNGELEESKFVAREHQV